METLLTKCVLPARPHALPFRVIFQELLQRRPEELLSEVANLPDAMDDAGRREFMAALQKKSKNPKAAEDALARAHAVLVTLLQEQEAAYDKLAAADLALQNGTAPRPLDGLVKLCAAKDAPLIRLLHGMELSALCLSGGGIRSASFSLGVMERLAQFSRNAEGDTGGLMDDLDYLSTVSGGGYIGSWMMSWAYRRFCSNGKRDWKTAYAEVISALAGNNHRGRGMPCPPAETAGDPEPQPVRQLRSYTSYLAPELGVTLDTFTLFAIVLRNLFVNWLMLLPLLFALVSGGRFAGVLLAWLHTHAAEWSSRGYGWLTVGGGVNALLPLSFVAVAWAAARALPSHATEAAKGADVLRRRLRYAYLFMGSVLLGAGLLTISGPGSIADAGCIWLVPDPVCVFLRFHPGLQAFLPEFLIGCLGFGIVAGSIYRADTRRMSVLQAVLDMTRQQQGQSRPAAQPEAKKQHRRVTTATAAVAATLAAAATASALLLLLRRTYQPLMMSPGPRFLQQTGPFAPAHGALFIVLVLPAIVSVLMLTASLFCALLGVFEQEEDREWWVRCGGALLGFCVCWVLGQVLIFYAAPAQYKVLLGLAGLALGLLSSLGGYSGVTSATASKIKVADLEKPANFLQKHQLLLPMVASVAVLLMAVGVTAIEEWMRVLWQPHFGTHPDGKSALALCAVCATLAGLLNWAININLFSLQGMYRMRLMRAYLGASNVLRRPDPFTGFDPKDTPQEFEMPCNPGIPMHLVNCTLNLTGTSNTAWRQRKAESFTFSPIVCGGWRLGYAATEQYGSERYGVSLASAMSISGAAFNPNMGYHTSPLLSLLMTFFNVRLGAWLPNPKWPAVRGMDEAASKAFVSRPGPTVALKPLIDEALGRANDTKAWVELSDGGHFENLGLYEMVLRRCHRLVVVDAGADETYSFEDLGNAIRKIRIDLGIPIEFKKPWKMAAGMDPDNTYCAVGTIRYSCVDPRAPDGYLVYIKPVLTGREPLDIYQYARTHASFPNETTANQFFNESQFESYRHLGTYSLDCIINAAAKAKYTLPNQERWKPFGSMARLVQLADAAQAIKSAAAASTSTPIRCCGGAASEETREEHRPAAKAAAASQQSKTEGDSTGRPVESGADPEAEALKPRSQHARRRVARTRRAAGPDVAQETSPAPEPASEAAAEVVTSSPGTQLPETPSDSIGG